MTPELSILLVSYNSRADLARCLPSIQGQDFSNYELIVVDNHGSDGVADLLTTHYPTVRLLPNPANTGYAGGNNLGLRQARGQWTLILNPDTELRPGCLSKLLVTLQANPDAFITPKLLNPDGRTINACGNQMHYTGITTCRGLNETTDAYQGLQAVGLLSGAAFIASTDALRQLGGFDEEYFMYFEDTDLSLRARLCGYRLLCQADAEIVHYYHLGLTADKFYYLERNRLLTLLKVLTWPTLLSLLPALLFTELATWAFALRGWAYLRARVRGYLYLWQRRSAIRHARVVIQATRRRADYELLAGSQTALPLVQVSAGPVSHLLDRLTRGLYQVLRPAGLR